MARALMSALPEAVLVSEPYAYHRRVAVGDSLTLRSDRGPRDYVVAGIYRDSWRQTSAGWRSHRRTLEVLWTEGNPKVVRP